MTKTTWTKIEKQQVQYRNARGTLRTGTAYQRSATLVKVQHKQGYYEKVAIRSLLQGLQG